MSDSFQQEQSSSSSLLPRSLSQPLPGQPAGCPGGTHTWDVPTVALLTGTWDQRLLHAFHMQGFHLEARVLVEVPSGGISVPRP